MGLTLAPIFSGSDGNCIYVASGTDEILIDAGGGKKRIEEEAARAGIVLPKIRAILVTHEHHDHIQSVGALSRRYHIPIYANELTWKAMSKRLGRIDPTNIRLIGEDDFYVGSLCVQPFRTSHDAACSCGYTVSSGDVKIAVMTDLGRVTQQILETVRGSRIVLLEANYDPQMLANGPYPERLKRRIASTVGHLSNPDAGKTAVELVKRGVRGILLSHLSAHNNVPELALETVRTCLEERGIIPGRHVALAAANRRELTGVYEL